MKRVFVAISRLLSYGALRCVAAGGWLLLEDGRVVQGLGNKRDDDNDDDIETDNNNNNNNNNDLESIDDDDVRAFKAARRDGASLLPTGLIGQSLAAASAGHAVVLAKRGMFVVCCFRVLSHTLYLVDSNGMVFVWRRGRFEQVFGDAKADDGSDASFIAVACGTHLYLLLLLVYDKSNFVGRQHVLALTACGHVWQWTPAEVNGKQVDGLDNVTFCFLPSCCYLLLIIAK
jgi:hypothetical protein